MTTGKTIALTRRTFVGKVMSLIFNMLSRLGWNFMFPAGRQWRGPRGGRWTELPWWGSVCPRPPSYSAPLAEGLPGPPAHWQTPSAPPTALSTFRHRGLWEGRCTQTQQSGQRSPREPQGTQHTPTVNRDPAEPRVQSVACPFSLFGGRILPDLFTSFIRRVLAPLLPWVTQERMLVI